MQLALKNGHWKAQVIAIRPFIHCPTLARYASPIGYGRISWVRPSSHYRWPSVRNPSLVALGSKKSSPSVCFLVTAVLPLSFCRSAPAVVGFCWYNDSVVVRFFFNLVAGDVFGVMCGRCQTPPTCTLRCKTKLARFLLLFFGHHHLRYFAQYDFHSIFFVGGYLIKNRLYTTKMEYVYYIIVFISEEFIFLLVNKFITAIGKVFLPCICANDRIFYQQATGILQRPQSSRAVSARIQFFRRWQIHNDA